MTETAHPKLDLAFSIAKRLIFDPIVEIELAILFMEAPWLAVWPLRQIVTALAHKVYGRAFGKFKETIDVAALPFINAAHERAFSAEFTKLMVIGDAEGEDSAAFKKAEEEAHGALANFTRYNATR